MTIKIEKRDKTETQRKSKANYWDMEQSEWQRPQKPWTAFVVYFDYLWTGHTA